MKKPTASELMKDPRLKNHLVIAGKLNVKAEDLPLPWVKNISLLMDEIRAWCKADPSRKPSVQFNFPNHMIVIKPLSVALEQKFISVDADGRLLMDHLLAKFPDSKEPTVMMIRVAFGICAEEGVE